MKQGVKTKDHEVEWIPNDDQLADEVTKTQEAHKSLCQTWKEHWLKSLIILEDSQLVRLETDDNMKPRFKRE